MSRDEEAAVIAAWRVFTAGRTIDRRTYLDFVHTRVYTHARFRRLSVFEILDAIVNAEPETAPVRVSA
jgi:hypothetical protein